MKLQTPLSLLPSLLLLTLASADSTTSTETQDLAAQPFPLGASTAFLTSTDSNTVTIAEDSFGAAQENLVVRTTDAVEEVEKRATRKRKSAEDRRKKMAAAHAAAEANRAHEAQELKDSKIGRGVERRVDVLAAQPASVLAAQQAMASQASGSASFQNWQGQEEKDDVAVAGAEGIEKRSFTSVEGGVHVMDIQEEMAEIAAQEKEGNGVAKRSVILAQPESVLAAQQAMASQAEGFNGFQNWEVAEEEDDESAIGAEGVEKRDLSQQLGRRADILAAQPASILAAQQAMASSAAGSASFQTWQAQEEKGEVEGINGAEGVEKRSFQSLAPKVEEFESMHESGAVLVEGVVGVPVVGRGVDGGLEMVDVTLN